MKLTPTSEQLEAQAAYLTGESLAIEALAGTGKTTLLRMLVDLGSPRGGSILYTSFGRKSVADAKAKFPASCKVATNHSLAWSVGVRYKNEGRLQNRIQAGPLADMMGWTEQKFAPHARLLAGAYGVIETLNAFCQSAEQYPSSEHAVPVALRLCKNDPAMAMQLAPVLVALAADVWDAAMRPNGRLPVTHDMYLKQWALSRPKLRYSTLLYDEAQDASGVMVGLLRDQTHAQLVVVGDRRQAIYGFRGAINAMDAFQTTHRTHLTRSFRFGPEIATVANAVLMDQCDTDLRLDGDPAQPGVVGPCAAPACVLARTNATLIGALFETISDRPQARLAVVGGVNELIDLVDGARQLQQSIPTAHPDLSQFDTWTDVIVASEDDAYAHLRVLVNLVQTYGVPSLKERLNQIRGNEEDLASCDTAFSTAHKAKGAEFASVLLTDDFKIKAPPPKPDLFGWTPEEGNLLYVACTRARQHLDALTCEAVMQSMAATGTRVPRPGLPEQTHAAAAGDGVLAAWDEAPLEEDAPPPDIDPFAILDELDDALDDGEGQVRMSVPAFALRNGDWTHPLIDGGVVSVKNIGDEVEVIVRAQGYILFHSRGDVEELGATTKRVTVRVGSASFDISPEAVAEPA